MITQRLGMGDAEPWTDPRFIERIAALQRHRLDTPVPPGVTVQVHDRSAVCTWPGTYAAAQALLAGPCPGRASAA